MNGFGELTRGIAQVIGVQVLWLAPLLAGLPVAWLCVRARSFHPIVARIWRLTMGRTPATHAWFAAAIAEREDLVRFRVIFGIPARTLAQAGRLRQWARQNDEDLSATGACGQWFDKETCSLRQDELPSERSQRLKQLAGMILLYLTLLATCSRCQTAPPQFASGVSGTTAFR